MLVSKDCLDLKLVKTAHAADNFIWVSGGDAVKLNSIGVGNYINLTLSDNRACETVRYDHVATWPATSAPKQLPVIRDVGATGRKNFGVNSCAVADWSVTQLTEYIEQVACAAPCVGGNTAAVASLSTSTSTKLSATASAIASLSTGVGSKLSTSFVSLASLSTSTSTGLSAADSAIASLSTLVTTKASLVGGTVPASQLPSYVDDVLEFPNSASFPAVGEAGKVYVDAGTNLTYRWSGTTYVALGGDYAVVARDQGTILTTAMDNINFIGAGVQATNTGSSVTVNVLDASATQAGSVELATPAETIAGTATTLAVTPAGLLAALQASLVNSPELVVEDGTNIPTVAPNAGVDVASFTMPKDGFVIATMGSSLLVGGNHVATILMDINRTSAVTGTREIASARQVFSAYSPGDYVTVSSDITAVSAGDTIHTRLTFIVPETTPCTYSKYLRVKYLN